MLDQDSALHDRVGSRTGLVLSGGGARGAYEIGVIAGFIEILDKRAGEHPPFEVFAGTSIGALNSALLASRADRGDLDIDALVNFWHQFQLEEYLKIEPRSWFGALSRGEDPPEASIFDPTPLKNFTQNLIPWERLQQNMKEGALRALIFTSWELATGRSVWFTQMAAGHDFPTGRTIAARLSSRAWITGTPWRARRSPGWCRHNLSTGATIAMAACAFRRRSHRPSARARTGWS